MEQISLQSPTGSSSGTDTRVVYDRQTGDILHVHQFISLPGVLLPNAAELSAVACDLASRITGKSIEHMGVLAVEEDELKNDANYRVDVTNACLVAQ
jgi:hypothetical protein